jgi:hypothetical protein
MPMPVPRLFEASTDPREQWIHVLATLLTLGGPSTRTALIAELAGEDLPGADVVAVFERRPVGSAVADILVRGAGWSLGVAGSLAFDADEAARITGLREALGEVYDRVIVVAVTPDRRPPAAVEAASAGGPVRHRSWLRVRDWVQERPERGRAEGTDLMLLREAEYFFTPRVAELYRLEGLMPQVPAGLRPTLAGVFFDLNELAPAPLITGEEGRSTVVFPRTGDAKVQIALGGGGMELRVAADQSGPGYSDAEGGWRRLPVTDPGDWVRARAWTQATARELLPVRR